MRSPEQDAAGPGGPEREGAVRQVRDAGSTRARLLEAARARFTRDGYTATTVREIAADAGVNVALINRYFTSKEGLFEACVTHAGEQLSHPHTREVTVDGIVQTILQHTTHTPGGDPSVQLLLLLQGSGDEHADQLRRSILEAFAQRMAAATGPLSAGADAGDVDTGGADAVLRAQMALAAALGVVLLRTTIGVEPLASADTATLEPILRDLLALLLTPQV